MTRRDWRGSTPTATYRAVVGLAFASLGCATGLSAAITTMLMAFHAVQLDVMVWLWMFVTPTMFLFLLWYLNRQYYGLLLIHYPPTPPEKPRVIPVVVNRNGGTEAGRGVESVLDY